MPRVTVIIPTFNRAGLVVETLRSVQAQTFRDLEILVVDAASTDDTLAVVGALAAEDPRIRLLTQPVDRGGQASKNLGLSQAAGEFVNFLDSDDLFAPTKIEKQVAAFDRDPALDIVVCQSLMFTGTPDSAEYVWNDLDPALTDFRELVGRVLRNEVGWGMLAPLWRRAYLDRLRPLPEDLRWCSDDRDLLLRGLCRGPHIAFLPEALAYVRLHGDPSLSKECNRPRGLHSRRHALDHVWDELRRAGLATPENRRSLGYGAMTITRAMAEYRMPLSALGTLSRALEIVPGAGRKLKLLLVGLPGLALVMLTRRSAPLVRGVFTRLDLEHSFDKYLRRRYVPPDSPDSSEQP